MQTDDGCASDVQGWLLMSGDWTDEGRASDGMGGSSRSGGGIREPAHLCTQEFPVETLDSLTSFSEADFTLRGMGFGVQASFVAQRQFGPQEMRFFS